MVRRSLDGYEAPFELLKLTVLVEDRDGSVQDGSEDMSSEAVVKVRVGSQVLHTASEGNGPVNALDNALAKGAAGVLPIAGCGTACWTTRCAW